MNKPSASTFAGARPLNAPRPLDVVMNRHGESVAVRKLGWPRRWRVVRVQDRWRIDDEWWRERPIARLYYLVELEGETLLTLYHDLAAKAWFEQRDHGVSQGSQ